MLSGDGIVMWDRLRMLRMIYERESVERVKGSVGLPITKDYEGGGYVYIT